MAAKSGFLESRGDAALPWSIYRLPRIKIPCRLQRTLGTPRALWDWGVAAVSSTTQKECGGKSPAHTHQYAFLHCHDAFSY
jgi:hypothetical protein